GFASLKQPVSLRPPICLLETRTLRHCRRARYRVAPVLRCLPSRNRSLVCSRLDWSAAEKALSFRTVHYRIREGGVGTRTVPGDTLRSNEAGTSCRPPDTSRYA